MLKRPFHSARLTAALPLAGLLLVGALLRLPSPDGSSTYLLSELQRDLLALQEMAAGRGVLLGPPCVHGGWYFPPAYHYLYLPLAALTGYRPYSLALTSALFSLLTILLIFHVARRWSRSRTAGYLVAGLLTISALDVQFAKYGSNPNALSFFGLLFFYELEKFISGKDRAADAVILGAAFAVATQLHTVAFVSLPLVLLAGLLWKKIKWPGPARALYFLLTVGLLYAPYLYAQFTRNFSDLAGLLGVAGGTSVHGTFPNRFADALTFALSLLVRYAQTFGDHLAAGAVWLSANIALVTLAWYLDGRHRRPGRAQHQLPPSVRTTLLLWLAVPLAVLLWPIGGIDILPLYYFTMLVPLGYLLLGLGLEKLWTRGFRLTAGALLSSYVLWQTIQLWQYHLAYPSVLTAWFGN